MMKDGTDRSRVRVTISIPKWILDYMKEEAKKADISLSQAITYKISDGIHYEQQMRAVSEARRSPEYEEYARIMEIVMKNLINESIEKLSKVKGVKFENSDVSIE